MDESTGHSGCAFLLIAIFTVLSSLLLSDPAAAELRFSILYHEPVVLLERSSTGRETNTPDDYEILSFDAFGRRFEVQLDPPTRLTNRDANEDFEIFSGRLQNLAGSWVRLMRKRDILSGVIHEAGDIYFIESRATVSEALTATNPQNDSTNIIYRLADTLVAPGVLSCETRHSNEPIDGQTAVSKLTAELNAVSPGTAAVEIPTANIGVIADLDFFTRFGSASERQIESLFNVVDGFFNEQVGVKINIAESLIVSSANQNPLSATTVGNDLLGELGNWRRINQADLDLTHLVTDRNLTGNNPFQFISGLSFLGAPARAGVCFSHSGAGMSTWHGNLTALIITHELAHNFGAPHDGEPSDNPSSANPCQSTPSSGFIMSASISSPGPDQFSQCSLREMKKVVDAADCLVTSAASTTEPIITNGGGGGGALDWLTWLILLGLTIMKRVMWSLSGTRRTSV